MIPERYAIGYLRAYTWGGYGYLFSSFRYKSWLIIPIKYFPVFRYYKIISFNDVTATPNCVVCVGMGGVA